MVYCSGTFLRLWHKVFVHEILSWKIRKRWRTTACCGKSKFAISSGWLMGIAVCHPDDLRYSPISSGWHNIIWTLSHPDEITILTPKSSGWLSYRQYLVRMTYGYCRMSSDEMTYDIVLSHPDDITSSGWVSSWSYLIRMTYGYCSTSSSWHIIRQYIIRMTYRNWYIIRMCHNNVIMSSGWHTLPFLSHPDEITNFDFPQHAVALASAVRWSVI